jgi:hypothetical protein
VGITLSGISPVSYFWNADAYAERGYVDDVIMPHSARRRIARALAMLRDKRVEMPVKKHDNLPCEREGYKLVERSPI